MDSPVDDNHYSGPEACRAAGVSYRQLDYWDRTGVVSPSRSARGSGSQRGYTVDEVVALALVGSVVVEGNHALPQMAVAAARTRAEVVVVSPGGNRVRPRFVPLVHVAGLDDLFATDVAVTVVAAGQIRRRVEKALETLLARQSVAA